MKVDAWKCYKNIFFNSQPASVTSHTYIRKREKESKKEDKLIIFVLNLHAKIHSQSMRPATSSMTRKPVIIMHPHRWLSPSFFRVNRMSESDDIMDSVFWYEGLKLLLKSWLLQLFCLSTQLLLLLLCTTTWLWWWWWWGRWICWLFKIWSFRSFNFSLLSIKLSLIDTGEAADDVEVVAVDSDADEVDGDFLLLDFFSFCNYFFIY